MTPLRRGFSLVELLISTGIAMTLASVATTAFIALSKTVARAEARLAMHTSAQRLHSYLNRTFASVQQTCAFVATSMSGTDVRLVFMRAKEHNWDFEVPSNFQLLVSPDLVWEELVWRRSTRTLLRGASSPSDQRTFVAGSFVVPTGIDYSGKTFYAVPQPRRTLNALDPLTGSSNSLNDNMAFPDTATPPISRANAMRDVGDFTDLERNLSPLLEHVTDLAFEIVSHDGSVLAVNDSTALTPPRVFPGVWLDGRMASSLTGAPTYAGSAIAGRPRTIRMRFTLDDPKTRVTSTFSFSFALPGLSADQ